MRDKLFGGDDPLGRSIRVNKISCEVIGLLASKGQSSFGTDQDDIVIAPLRMYQRRIAGNSDVATILVSAEEGTDTAKVQADIERLLQGAAQHCRRQGGRLLGARPQADRADHDHHDRQC